MHKNYIVLYTLISILSLALTSCDSEDETAEALLYSNQTISPVAIDMILSRVNAWELEDGNVLYGLDVSIMNINSVPIYDVYIYMDNVSPLSSVADYSATNWRYIEEISANSNQKPIGYWCFYCDTPDEIYVGNFYVELVSYVTGGQTYQVVFNLEFSTDQRNYEFSLSKTFTTVYNPLKNVIEIKSISDISFH